jgi:hypothetical protein
VHDEKELYWAAGFLEGDGSFGTYNDTLSVRANQTATKEPLERLQRLFGGNICFTDKETTRQRFEHYRNTKDCWQWYIYNALAFEAMTQLLPHMSQHRQIQIVKALALFVSTRSSLVTALTTCAASKETTDGSSN